MKRQSGVTIDCGQNDQIPDAIVDWGTLASAHPQRRSQCQGAKAAASTSQAGLGTSIDPPLAAGWMAHARVEIGNDHSIAKELAQSM